MDCFATSYKRLYEFGFFEGISMVVFKKDFLYSFKIYFIL